MDDFHGNENNGGSYLVEDMADFLLVLLIQNGDPIDPRACSVLGKPIFTEFWGTLW